ncbi:MAG: acyltransferase [Myxococcota bacterium]
MTERVNVYVHPTAVVDEPATLGEGVRIWHFCHVMAGAVLGPGASLGQNVYVAPTVVLGKNCKIQNNVALYDGVECGDDVFLGPSCVFTNVSTPRSAVNRRGAYEKTILEDGVSVGANATIVCGTRIGHHAFIAAGAVVTRDIPPHALVMGVPARVVGLACHCGLRLHTHVGVAWCDSCGNTYTLDADGGPVLDPAPAAAPDRE